MKVRYVLIGCVVYLGWVYANVKEWKSGWYASEWNVKMRKERESEEAKRDDV